MAHICVISSSCTTISPTAKNIKRRITESLIKMSCLLHKQEKRMAHVTSEVQVAAVAKCGHQYHGAVPPVSSFAQQTPHTDGESFSCDKPFLHTAACLGTRWRLRVACLDSCHKGCLAQAAPTIWLLFCSFCVDCTGREYSRHYTRIHKSLKYSFSSGSITSQKDE